MSCYSLKGLLGVPGGSYRILTTLKGIWRILEVEEFLSGPYMSFKVYTSSLRYIHGASCVGQSCPRKMCF